jgi:diguanylate cyclase (GGDEF)-like protein
VIWLLGEPASTHEAWPYLAPLLLSQLGLDAIVSMLREWAGRGIGPGAQMRVMALVCAVDLMLAPVGLLAAIATRDSPAGWLLAAPLALLLGALAEDRRRRIAGAVASVEELHRERERLREVLRRAGRAMASNLDRNALLDALADTAAEGLEAEVGWVCGARRDDPPPAALLAEDGVAIEHALRTAVKAARARNGLATDEFAGWHSMAWPLHRRGSEPETIAVARRERAFAQEEMDVFRNLAEQAAVTMTNADLHERLRVQAMEDELTGLANHRHMQEFLSEAADRAARTGEPLGLVLLDLDDFKNINDTYGHQQGDFVLRLVGRAVGELCRAEDEAARYGGEELAIVLPGCGLEETYAMAERVRAAVAALRFPLQDGSRHELTLSAGAACLPLCAPDKQTLIAAADAALYGAKDAGKNRTMIAPARFVAR